MSDSGNKSTIISLVAETHIHPGVGQSTGALDLPVARERTTHFPFIPGSGVKGAFRVWAKERASGLDIDRYFGKESAASADEGGDGNAGDLLCSDARLLLLPVRCLSDSYKWVTCQTILKRFQRDRARALNPVTIPDIAVADGTYLGAQVDDGVLALEEREFSRADVDHAGIAGGLAGIVDADDLAKRLVVLSDRDFVWFARYALPVMARNALDKNKKVKRGALWHEETLAPDTILYLLFGERNEGAVDAVATAIGEACYIQMGGNETIGQGWFRMQAHGRTQTGESGHG